MSKVATTIGDVNEKRGKKKNRAGKADPPQKIESPPKVAEEPIKANDTVAANDTVKTEESNVVEGTIKEEDAVQTKESDQKAAGDEVKPDDFEALVAEQKTLKKKRMNDKDVKILDKTLIECKDTAKVIKGEVLQLLTDRVDCEKECLELEVNIGKKITAITANFGDTIKECTEVEEPEVTTVRGGSPATVVSREKRSSKSATPPPAVNDKAIQKKISDLDKQEPKKSSGASRKKAIESLLKSVESIEDSKEKLLSLCKVNLDLEEKLREAEANAEKWKKQFQNEQRDCNRSVLAKDRLENLSRDLQKRNNALKEELDLRRREDEERRKELLNKFTKTFTELSSLMTETQLTSKKLRQDNTQLAEKLRSLVDHYELWDKHAAHMLNQKSIEVELGNARLRESQLYREKENKEAEQIRKFFELTVNDLKNKLEHSLKQEIKLREELHLHNEKYNEFQTAFDSSNKVFSTFKNEVETMSKNSKKLENDALAWKKRYENSERATARVMQEKISTDVKCETLTRLCRALQDKLKMNPTEAASMEKSLATEVVNEEKAKMKAELERKEAEIKAQMAILQAQQQDTQQKMLEEANTAKMLKENIAEVKAKAESSVSTNEQTAATTEETQSGKSEAGRKKRNKKNGR